MAVDYHEGDLSLYKYNYLTSQRRFAVDRFIDGYASMILPPLILQNHIGPISFSSDLNKVEKRQGALRKYFIVPGYPKDNDYYWGRTILSEIFFRRLFSLCNPVLESNGLTMRYSTTSIDKSSVPGDDDYQKGADFVIARKGQVLEPICGIDITVATETIVRDKRNRPGYQEIIAMPVIVVPLRDLTLFRSGLINFPTFLDEFGRKECIEDWGFNRHLSEREIVRWLNLIINKMRYGTQACRSSLALPQYHDQVGSYPYVDKIMSKLNLVESLLPQFYQYIATHSI